MSNGAAAVENIITLHSKMKHRKKKRNMEFPYDSVISLEGTDSKELKARTQILAHPCP